MDLESLASPKGITTLPYHYDFIITLFNDGYSNHTIYNYYRDLIIFSLFLQDIGISFNNLKVEHITFYKGWLKERKHIKAIKRLLKKRNVQSHQVDEENNGKAAGKGVNVRKQTNTDKGIEKQKQSKQITQVANKSNPTLTYLGGFIKNSNPAKLDANTINRMLVTIRKYLRFLIEQGHEVPIMPDQIKLVRTPKRMLKIPDIKDVLALVGAPSKYESNPFVALRNRAMLETLLATGMRISELCSLNREQIGADDKLYIIGKGNKERIVYLTPRAKKHLNKYLEYRNDPYPALFVPLWVYKRFNRLLGGKAGAVSSGGSDSAGKTSGIRTNIKTEDPRIKPNYLQAKIAEYRRILKLGVPISAHTIRHAFATYLIENGANVEAVRILLGHASLSTTTKYVHAAQEFAHETHRKLHPVRE